MNRSHTAESYLRLLERFRAARPDLALSGDFIVGFPGETDAEFEETLKLVDAVGYAQAFSFKYSPRPGTPAASMEGQVAKEVMDDRLQRLQAALNRDQWAFNRATEGRTCEVLVERKGKHPGQWLGKTPWLQSAWFEGDVGIGEQEPRSGFDLHIGLGGLAFGEAGVHAIGVVALGAEHRDGVLGGFAGLAAQLEAVLRRAVRVAHGALDSVPQVVADLALQHGARLGARGAGAIDTQGSRGDGCEDGSSHAITLPAPRNPRVATSPSAVTPRRAAASKTPRGRRLEIRQAAPVPCADTIARAAARRRC